MRFFLLLAFALVLRFEVHSQVRWNIFGGPQLISSFYSVGGVHQHNTFKEGFQLGLGAKVPFENVLSFSPCVFYSLKGYKVRLTVPDFPPDLDATDNNTTIHTFEVAGLFQIDFNLKPSHVFIKGGPSLDFQLAGHEKYNLSTGGSVSHSMPYSYAAYGRFSANLIVQFGYESKNCVVYLQYGRGVTSLNNADGGPNILHRTYGISFAKYLHKK